MHVHFFIGCTLPTGAAHPVTLEILPIAGMPRTQAEQSSGEQCDNQFISYTALSDDSRLNESKKAMQRCGHIRKLSGFSGTPQ